MASSLALFSAWMTLAGGLGVAWAVRFFLVRAVAGRRAVISSKSASQSGEQPRLSVVIAAKDEEQDIAACVSSLLDQDYRDYQIIVVDDRSTDRTLAILKELEKNSNGRMRAISITSLPNGWAGKNHAMHKGVQESDGKWFLFTDADCRFRSNAALSTAMREAADHEADFLSIVPILESEAIWERILQPVCALVLILWFLPEKVNDPARKTAYANGAFMLMSRSCYDSLGGHEAIRDVVQEDIRLAQMAKRCGLRLRVAENEGMYTTRMYAQPREAWNGWTRIFSGSLQNMRRLLISASSLAFLSITPWASLGVAVVGLAMADAEAEFPWKWAVYAWLAVVVAEQATSWLIYRMMRVKLRWSLTYVIGAVATLAILVNAMRRVRGSTQTTWRGTTYGGSLTDTPTGEPASEQPAERPTHA